MSEPPFKRRKTDGRGGRGRGRGRGGGRGRGRGGKGGGQRERKPLPPSPYPLLRPEEVLPNEADLGMTAYLDVDRPSFVAAFKQRYSDFIVREVDDTGAIVRLTDITTLPEIDMELKRKAEVTFTEEEKKLTLKPLLEAHELEGLLAFAALPPGDPKRKEGFRIYGPVVNDKDTRTQFYQALKQTHKQFAATTVAEDDLYQGRVWERKKAKRKEVEYLAAGASCSLQIRVVQGKQGNIELDLMAKFIGCHSKVFSFAGTKDKRAVTTQWVTAYHVDAERLRDMNQHLIGIKCGNFTYSEKPLSLGDHMGNHFTITLRDVDAPRDVLERALKKVEDYGFINYFGSQRFGTGTVTTHSVGRLLLQQKWEEALTSLLRPRAFEDDETLRARIHFQQGKNAKESIPYFPPRCNIERQLLYGIDRFGMTVEAIHTLNFKTRLLYVHAYQSWIFNLMASKRIQSVDHLKPIVGDLVLAEGQQLSEDDDDLNGSTGRGRDSERMEVDDGPTSSIPEIIVLTPENVDKYTIFDVVLPLPGYSVTFPQNHIGEWAKQFMREDGVDPDQMKTRVFSLPGNYRPLLLKPRAFSYTIVTYDDPEVPLVATDIDEINNTAIPPLVSNGKHLGVLIEMALNSGTYATMLLRELTKNSTTQKYQRELQAKREDREQAEDLENSEPKLEGEEEEAADE